MKKIEYVEKSLTGRTVWLRGRGNNARRQGITPLLEATVVKVNPKTVVLDIVGRHEKIDRSGECLGDVNASFEIFLSREDAIAARQAGEARIKIQEALRWNQSLEPDVILEFAAKLGIELSPEPHAEDGK